MHQGYQVSPRSRVIEAAERLFSDRGYKAVTLRDIAEELGIRQASLYYHFPSGKEEMFIEVIEHAMARHSTGLQETIAAAPDDVESQLRAVARWMLAQPPVDLSRMVRSDMREISEPERKRLTQVVLQSVVHPIEEVFDRGIEREGLHPVGNNRLLAGSLLSIIETVQVSPQFNSRTGEEMADEMISILMDGLRPREL